MMSKEEIDYKLAAEQLRTGKPLFGKEGRDCKQGISVCQNPKASRRISQNIIAPLANDGALLQSACRQWWLIPQVVPTYGY
jgi:hypothetical protein